MTTRRILIVDDEPLISMMLEDWLSEIGIEPVGPASSVKSAMALIDGAPLDGAILDVSLGEESCYPIAQALIGRAVPVALATGHDIGSIDERFRSLPTLAKPYEFEAVKRLIERLAPLSSIP